VIGKPRCQSNESSSASAIARIALTFSKYRASLHRDTRCPDVSIGLDLHKVDAGLEDIGGERLTRSSFEVSKGEICNLYSKI
jgi:hypothetical protein